MRIFLTTMKDVGKENFFTRFCSTEFVKSSESETMINPSGPLMVRLWKKEEIPNEIHKFLKENRDFLTLSKKENYGINLEGFTPNNASLFRFNLPAFLRINNFNYKANTDFPFFCFKLSDGFLFIYRDGEAHGWDEYTMEDFLGCILFESLWYLSSLNIVDKIAEIYCLIHRKDLHMDTEGKGLQLKQEELIAHVFNVNKSIQAFKEKIEAEDIDFTYYKQLKSFDLTKLKVLPYSSTTNNSNVFKDVIVKIDQLIENAEVSSIIRSVFPKNKLLKVILLAKEKLTIAALIDKDYFNRVLEEMNVEIVKYNSELAANIKKIEVTEQHDLRRSFENAQISIREIVKQLNFL